MRAIDFNKTHNLNVKDVPCERCIRHKRMFDLFDGGYCTRLTLDCNLARELCVKSAWYAEMCAADAILEAAIREDRAE